MKSEYSFIQTSWIGGSISLSAFRASQYAQYGMGKLFSELLDENTWSKEFFVRLSYQPNHEGLVVTCPNGEEVQIYFDIKSVDGVKKLLESHLKITLNDENDSLAVDLFKD